LIFWILIFSGLFIGMWWNDCCHSPTTTSVSMLVFDQIMYAIWNNLESCLHLYNNFFFFIVN
jgi:hypothetical protein